MADEVIIVTIDGQKYATIMDNDGVQRFPQNRIIRYLLDSNPTVGLDDLWNMLDAGMISRTELMKFYMQIGYTLSGFEELFSNSEIDNPARGD